MDTLNSNPNQNPKYLGQPEEASFFLLSCKGEKPITKVNPFVVTKTVESLIGTPKQFKRLIPSKQVLVEVAKKDQARKLLQLDKIDGLEIAVEPHPTLNSIKGVLKDQPGILADLTESEILEGIKDQGIQVVHVRRLVSRRDGKETPLNTYICTFGTPSRPPHVR